MGVLRKEKDDDNEEEEEEEEDDEDDEDEVIKILSLVLQFAFFGAISPAGENRRSSRNKPNSRLCVIFLVVLLALCLMQNALWGLAT